MLTSLVEWKYSTPDHSNLWSGRKESVLHIEKEGNSKQRDENVKKDSKGNARNLKYTNWNEKYFW